MIWVTHGRFQESGILNNVIVQENISVMPYNLNILFQAWIEAFWLRRKT